MNKSIDRGKDSALARIAAEISALAGREGGPCTRVAAVGEAQARRTRSTAKIERITQELDAAARSVTEEFFVVVLGNDLKCDEARTTYQQSAKALARAGLPRSDVYWARERAFWTQSECAPPP